MYHYVRDLEHSRFPAIKGLTLERFRRQLDFIQSRYTAISVEDVFEALKSSTNKLPENAILLTFDDGYSDHFLNVFPLLDARGIKGCFFPPAQAVLEHVVLDVNKIQFVLAAVQDARNLLGEILDAIEGFRSQYQLKSRDEYLAAVTEKHRYDMREVTVIKRLLQRELPEPVRTAIVQRLFERYVATDETAFAMELYMSLDQIECMRRHGMHIGSHGYTHAWMNHISPAEQAVETDRSLEFLKLVGSGKREWTMCYPYGGFNDSLLHVLRERSCSLGFTVDPRIADLNFDDPLTLPRIDTNDLPS
jgi:peptidoglycan/xylan/chitin deacetylase (PgdA/CDA1 family)